MAAPAQKFPRWFMTCLWGNTVALSWMWGLGLFFSVQFTTQFGLPGLLAFAVPNAVGLWVFGLITHHLARRQQGGSESLAQFYHSWSRPLRLLFFLYQLLAITLTIFAFMRYVWQPLGFAPETLFLPLTMLVALAAAILFGEEFNIRRIKWSHGVMMLFVAAAVGVLMTSAPGAMGPVEKAPEARPLAGFEFWGFGIPIVVGFLLGPWLDLQQWQRAIQMHRERISVAGAYALGAAEFFLLLLFHGWLAWQALGRGGAEFLREGLAPYLYGHDVVMRLLFAEAQAHPWVFGAYCVFVAVCLLSTLDSGYIALRWFLQSGTRSSNNPLLIMLPQGLLTSPIPVFAVAGVVALAGAALRVELEYFMIFYATFFVGYSALAVARCFVNTPGNAIPQVKMFCIGSLAVLIFAYGYFLTYPVFMIAGSLLPLGYVLWILFKPTAHEDFVKDAEELSQPLDGAGVPARSGEVAGPIMDAPDAPRAAGELAGAAGAGSGAGGALAAGVGQAVQAVSAALQSIGGHFEGKWFVHSFVATYADTNSVGNVYFGMYAMWVGKTRELFFNKVMPKFNLKTTPFYILTRSFEHKFIRETREFETVVVKIRIASYNRKFVTLEHEIYDSQQRILGRGKQTLLFVSSADYKMIDIPAEVATAFMAHT